MRALIKSLIMFTIIFMLFFPLSIAMDETFTGLDNSASQYHNSTLNATGVSSSTWNTSSEMSNFTSFYANVFRIIYSISGGAIICNMILLAVFHDEDRRREFFEE